MKTFVTFCLGVMAIAGHAQPQQLDLQKLFNDESLDVVNRAAQVVGGTAKSVKLGEGDGEGIAWVKDTQFAAGTIEVDLRGRDVQGKSFLGIAFHGANDSTYEAIYFRPFNFRTADAVRRIHAVQYICHPNYRWKKLRDEHNGVYESALLNPPEPGAWFHARIVVKGDDVSVYVNGDQSPSLVVKKLGRITDGKIGLWVGDGADGEFANLNISR